MGFCGVSNVQFLKCANIQAHHIMWSGFVDGIYNPPWLTKTTPCSKRYPFEAFRFGPTELLAQQYSTNSRRNLNDVLDLVLILFLLLFVMRNSNVTTKGAGKPLQQRQNLAIPILAQLRTGNWQRKMVDGKRFCQTTAYCVTSSCKYWWRNIVSEPVWVSLSS